MSILDRIMGRRNAQRTSPAKAVTRYIRTDAVERDQPSALFGFGGGAGTFYYEALRSSEARTRILTAQFMAGGDLSRRELALLARAMYDNSGHAALAVDQIAQYSAPVLVKAASPDSEWNSLADIIFGEFAERADFYARPDVNLATLQRDGSVAVDLDGDQLAVLTRSAGFPQVQLIDGHRVTTPEKLPKGVTVDGGVELDEFGRTVAYHVESTEDSWTRVPAGNAFLLRDSSPVNPRRGISPLRRGLNDLRDARDILGFEKGGVKFNASNPGYIEGNLSADAAKEFQTGDDEDLPAPAETLPDKVARLDLSGGDILNLDGGRKYVPISANRPNAQFGEFIDTLFGAFAAGLGIPPSFFLDAKMTGPGWRAVIGKAQRRFDDRQGTFERFTRWLFVRVIGDAIASGVLPEVTGWQKCTCQRPARITIDLGDEAAADREAVAAHLMTRAQYSAKRQRDWEDDITQSLVEEKRILDGVVDLAASTGIPVETLLGRYGFQVAQQQQKPETK